MDWTRSDPEARGAFRRAVVVAYVCFGANLVASAAAALILRHGSDLHPLAERSSWVLANVRDWRIAWGTWMVAGPTLVLFYAAFAATLSDEMRLVRGVAVATATAGLAADLYAEYLLAFLLPARYASLPPGESTRVLLTLPQTREVLAAEGTATLLTGALANGLYTIAGMMIAVAAHSTRGFPRALAWASAPAWALGIALSVSVMLRHPWATAVSMAALMACFLAWVAAVTHALWRRAMGRVDKLPASK